MLNSLVKKHFKDSTRSNAGFSLISVMVFLLIIAYAGAAVLETSAADTQTGLSQYDSSRASYVAFAGMEYAKYRLSRAENAAVTNVPFDNTNLASGSFSVQPDPRMGTITVAANVGKANRKQSFQTKFAADCISTDGATVTRNESFLQIKDLEFKKECLELPLVKIDRIRVTQVDSEESYELTQVITENGCQFNTLPGFAVVGNAISPHEANIDDVRIEDNEGHFLQVLRLDYSQNSVPLAPTVFEIMLVFSDGSDKTVRFTL